jgi:Na+-translocating ferredoxin:NAD+ oxidoreductase RnfG subunit
MKNTKFVLLALTALLAFGFLVACADGEDKEVIKEVVGIPGGAIVGSGTGYRPVTPVVLAVKFDGDTVLSYTVLAHNESTGTGFGYGLPAVGTAIVASDHSPVGTRWSNLTTKFVSKTAPISVVATGIDATATSNANSDVCTGATYSWSGIARAINNAHSKVSGGTGTATGVGTGYSNNNGTGFDIELSATFSGNTVTSYTITKHNESSGTGTGYNLPTNAVASLRDSGATHMNLSWPILLTLFNGRTLPLKDGTAKNGTDITASTVRTLQALKDAAAADAVTGATYSYAAFATAINAAYDASKF